MPPQTFFSGGWAGRKWATDHHRRSLPFKKQHKSKDEIFKCLKGAKSVKSGAEDTGPVTCLQPAILRVKSEKKPHVTSIPSLGFYRKIAKLFSKEKKVQINFSSMFYCILATFSFYFLPSPPQSSLFEASHRQDPQASFSLLHPFRCCIHFSWGLTQWTFYKTLSFSGSRDAFLSSCLPPTLYPTLQEKNLLLHCFLSCSLSANCSSRLLSDAAWRSHASEEDKGAISTCPGCQELAEGTTPEGTCVYQWRGSSRNKNALSEASMENWQHRTLPPHWHVNPRNGGTTPKNRTWNPL